MTSNGSAGVSGRLRVTRHPRGAAPADPATATGSPATAGAATATGSPATGNPAVGGPATGSQATGGPAVGGPAVGGAATALLTHAEPVMGTVFSLTAVTHGVSPAALRAAVAQACQVLHDADAVFSTWDPDSPLSRYRRGEVPAGAMPPEFSEVVAECQRAKAASAGWFDPWAMPGGFDPTGLVKGWAVERALAVLREAGVPAALINGGGDVAAFGQPSPGHPWRVGVRHPWRPDALACVLETTAAVATSGPYERGPHLVNPQTGQPHTGAVSATVTGPSLTHADALATALAVAPTDVEPLIAQLPGYAAYVIHPNGAESHTPGIPFAPSPPPGS